jgi:hypothetical protein
MIAGHYSGVDRDMLLAGVILHDVGKTRELEYTRRIDYSDEGRLLSHIIIGLSMLDEKLKQVPDFPDLQAQLLKHMIVSHHGSRAFGSPEPPKTIEAVLLNYIDEMDSRVNSIREYVAKDRRTDHGRPITGCWNAIFTKAPARWKPSEPSFVGRLIGRLVYHLVPKAKRRLPMDTWRLDQRPYRENGGMPVFNVELWYGQGLVNLQLHPISRYKVSPLKKKRPDHVYYP